MQLRHIALVTRFELGRVLRSAPGAVFLVLFSVFYLWLGTKLSGMDEALRVLESARILGEGEDNVVFEFLGWVTGLEPLALWELFDEYPPILIALFATTLMMLPAMALLATADQTASDIGTKHIRFLLVRVDRTSIYIGKTLGATLFFTLSLTIAILGVGAVVVLGGLAPMGEAIPYLIRIWLLCVLFSLPFVALSGLAGALTGNTALGLLTTFGLYAMVAMISGWGSIAQEELRLVRYVFPTALKFQLLSTDSGDLLTALAHQLSFAAVAFMAGLTLFRRRGL